MTEENKDVIETGAVFKHSNDSADFDDPKIYEKYGGVKFVVDNVRVLEDGSVEASVSHDSESDVDSIGMVLGITEFRKCMEIGQIERINTTHEAYQKRQPLDFDVSKNGSDPSNDRKNLSDIVS